MPLLAVTRDFLALVERETGFPAKLVEDPNLDTLARVQIARDPLPAHFVRYKPTKDESLDYMICYQCGFVLRLFETPPGQRFSFGVTSTKADEIVSMLVGPGGKLAQFRLSATQARQMAEVYLNGVMTHLRSIPIGMRVAEWIGENYPELKTSQRAAVLKELADAKAALQPQIRDTTPEAIYKPSIAISAAHAMFWSERYNMPELAAPYRSYGYHRDGSALLEIWREVPSAPAHDCELVDRWADKLHLNGWYKWMPYMPPK